MVDATRRAKSTERARRSGCIGRLVLVAVGLVGLVLMVRQGAELYRGLAARAWPQAEGVVLESGVRRHGSAGTRGGTTYEPWVRYRYTAGGRSWTGTRIWRVGQGSTLAWARGVAAEYPAGRRVRVYYDPEDPSASLLRPGLGGGALVGFFTGLVFFLLAAGFLWLLSGVPRGEASAGGPLHGDDPAPAPPDSGATTATGIPTRVLLVFSGLWALLSLPAAVDAWRGYAAPWLLAAPFIGPLFALLAGWLGRRQRATRAHRAQGAATVEEGLRRLGQGETLGPHGGPAHADPERVRRWLGPVTLAVVLSPLLVLAFVLADWDLEAGPMGWVFAGTVLVGVLLAWVARRKILRLYEGGGGREAVPPVAPGPRRAPRVRDGGLWIAAPILLVSLGLWAFRHRALEPAPDPRGTTRAARHTPHAPPAPRPIPAPATPPLPEPGPSPCPGLLAKVEAQPAAPEEATLRRLLECKMRRPHYQHLRRDSALQRRAFAARSQPQWYPEERAIRRTLLALAATRRPPPGTEVHPVPHLSRAPTLDGRVEETPWGEALSLPLPGLPEGARSRLRLGWHGDALYLAVELAPADRPDAARDARRSALRVDLQPGLSRWLDSQYFFVYLRQGRSEAGEGCRIAEALTFPEPPPEGGWPPEERWKGIRFNECGLFAVDAAAGVETDAQGRRWERYEARVALADAAIERGHPFTLDVEVQVGLQSVGAGTRTGRPLWLELK
ncbi:MAG: DUF3592 domain-containing protein [Deltaproteobacteria bacterium]|nr:MAG: DUF3592 domain-containing protein [Deltaproteobacteria bacterium]